MGTMESDYSSVWLQGSFVFRLFSGGFKIKILVMFAILRGGVLCIQRTHCFSVSVLYTFTQGAILQTGNEAMNKLWRTLEIVCLLTGIGT